MEFDEKAALMEALANQEEDEYLMMVSLRGPSDDFK
jgi:hypothetical protein